MSTAAQPQLEPGRAYRTRDLRRWSANPTRLARRLVDEGKLREAAHGLYYAPVPTKFGPAPAADEELLRAFLGDVPFLVTGPPRWNALGLGSTAMFAMTLVYNTRRTGEVVLGGRRFLLRRVYFPREPTPEWFVATASGRCTRRSSPSGSRAAPASRRPSASSSASPRTSTS